MSVGGRLVLINSVLTSLTMFMLSFFEVPKGVLEKLDYYRSRFFWQSDEHKKKYRLVKWSILCQPKEIGGLGIKNLDIQNRCLLSKWLFKLINEEGIWQSLLRNKYLKNQTIAQVEKKSGDSHFWAGLMKVKDTFLNHGSFHLNDGNQKRFWEDKWIGNHTLREQYPDLYNIVRKKHATVASVFSRVPLNVSFRRSLTGHLLILWHDLVAQISHVRLNNNADVFRWNLNQAGVFTVSSMYNALISNGNIQFDKHLWN